MAFNLPLAAVESNPHLPDRVDVAVIGGGIAGVCAAWHLARMGERVALFEKGLIGAEQSCRNWGFCRQQGRDPREIPLIQESMRQWRAMNRAIDAETGFKTVGIAFIAKDEDALNQFESWSESVQDAGLDTRVIGRQALRGLYPEIKPSWPGALYTPSDGRAEPFWAVPAIARSAQLGGVSLHQQCAVRGIETEGGQISEVLTELGAVKADRVLVAGGAWSRIFLRSLGVFLPQLTVRSSVLRTAPAPDVIGPALWGPGFAARRRDDGGYSVAQGGVNTVDLVPDNFRLFFKYLSALKAEWGGLRVRFGRRFIEHWRMPSCWAPDRPSPFEAQRILNPDPDYDLLDSALRQLAKNFPQLEGVNVLQRWAGYIDVTPDAVPAISDVPDVPGLYVSTGYSGHGFGIGPGAGRLAAELMTGAATCVDPEPFRYGRFVDGTPMRVSGEI